MTESSPRLWTRAISGFGRRTAGLIAEVVGPTLFTSKLTRPSDKRGEVRDITTATLLTVPQGYGYYELWNELASNGGNWKIGLLAIGLGKVIEWRLERVQKRRIG